MELKTCPISAPILEIDFVRAKIRAEKGPPSSSCQQDLSNFGASKCIAFLQEIRNSTFRVAIQLFNKNWENKRTKTEERASLCVLR